MFLKRLRFHNKPVKHPKKNDFTIVVACDGQYLREHAVALACSLDQYAPGRELRLCVVNPDIDAQQCVKHLQKTLRRMKIKLDTLHHDLSGTPVEYQKVYYACARFLIIPDMLQTGKPLLVLDADSLVRASLDMLPHMVEHYDFAALRRAQSREPKGDFAAGVLFIRPTEASCAFFSDVKTRIESTLSTQQAAWFLDQETLSVAYSEHRDKLRFYCLPSIFVDWRFCPESIIWTAKGERKNNNAIYLQEKRVTLRRAGVERNMPWQ